MEKDQSPSVAVFSFRSSCCILILVSSVSSISFLYWSQYHSTGSSLPSFSLSLYDQNTPINLLTYTPAWNHLSFSSDLPRKLLKIALFVKKWPQRNLSGGLEHHALTLHLALAKRGHELHIFTTTTTTNSSSNDTNTTSFPNMNFHLSRPSAGGYLDQALVWNQFQIQNLTGKPFDVVHTESVGLLHYRARNVNNLVVSWHVIAYETIHSDIIQEMIRSSEEPRSHALIESAVKVVDEGKFFQRYSHHVATSDHCGDVLRRIYMIHDGRVHVILNGVDEQVFKPNPVQGKAFRHKVGIPEPETTLVFGMAGRLVKDKGHPIMFEALSQSFAEQDDAFRKRVYVIVAGDGPWGARYRELGSNLLVLVSLKQSQLAIFYNAIDVFVNPTLRAQGIDHTLLEATLSGKPVMATRFASITGSVIVGPEMGYTFSPTASSLKYALLNVIGDGRKILEKKGEVARQRALKLFTTTKMTAAYERLFLCISNNSSEGDYCRYKPPPQFSI